MDYTICTHEQGIADNNPSFNAPLTITAEYGYMETISKGLGHSNTAVTKKHYAQPSIDTLKQVMDNLRNQKSS